MQLFVINTKSNRKNFSYLIWYHPLKPSPVVNFIQLILGHSDCGEMDMI